MEYFYCIQKETVGCVSNDVLYLYKVDSNGFVYVPVWDDGLQCISNWIVYDGDVNSVIYFKNKYIKTSLKEIQQLCKTKKYRLYRWYRK